MTPRIKIRCFVKLVRNSLLFIIAFLILIIYRGQTVLRSNFEQKLPRSLQKYVMFKEVKHRPLNASQIRQMIHRHNEKQYIQNLDMYGPVKKNTLILVISVHKLTAYLKYTILSLSFTRGIEDTLLIFSHAYYDENLNSFIKSIDFCRVIQLFYPYSVQIYPNEFPGFGPKDCPSTMSLSQASKAACVGADSPDIHGRFRNPTSAEAKHRWWWTANTVFEDLSAIHNHEGMVVFFEEDLYFLEDFVYMVLFMKEAALDSKCEFLSLGARSMVHNQKDSMYKMDVMTWDPRQHADVLAFDSTIWNSIAAHYDLFCSVDDVSWASSLYYLSLNRKDGKRFKVMATTLPRATKLSAQPLYRKLFGHDWITTVFEIIDIQRNFEEFSYPPHLEIYTLIELDAEDRIYEYAESTGGWADPRDVGLCMNMTVSKIKKVLLDANSQFSEYEDSSNGNQFWQPESGCIA